jgi:hypothetical protein
LVEIVSRTGSAERARDFTARRAKNSRCRGLQAAFVVARVEGSAARACVAFENYLRLAPCFILVAAARDPQIQGELSVKLWARVVVGEYIRELF